MRTNLPESPTHLLICEVEIKSTPPPPLRLTLTATHLSSKKKGHPMLTQVPHCHLTNVLPHLQATRPMTYSDQLDPSGPDLWLISGSKPHKRIPSSTTYSHTSSPINKSKFKPTIKHTHNLGSHNTERDMCVRFI